MQWGELLQQEVSLQFACREICHGVDTREAWCAVLPPLFLWVHSRADGSKAEPA